MEESSSPVYRSIRVENPDTIQSLRIGYLRTTIAPMDGMWEASIIAGAAFWDIRDGRRSVGHFVVGSDGCLLRFQPTEACLSRAEQLFLWVVSDKRIQRAAASTVETLYFSLCLDTQALIRVHSYLFRDNGVAGPGFGPHVGDFKNAEQRDLANLTRFYCANTDGSGEWIEGFLHDRLARKELFGLYSGDVLLAVGECIPSLLQPPYADLGVIVARLHRRRGLATAMLSHLKEQCRQVGLSPICSCAVDNTASHKAIERAGFVSEHRIVEVTFGIHDGQPQNRLKS